MLTRSLARLLEGGLEFVGRVTRICEEGCDDKQRHACVTIERNEYGTAQRNAGGGSSEIEPVVNLKRPQQDSLPRSCRGTLEDACELMLVHLTASLRFFLLLERRSL